MIYFTFSYDRHLKKNRLKFESSAFAFEISSFRRVEIKRKSRWFKLEMSKLKFKSWADSKVRSRKNLLKEKLLRKSLKWLFMVLRKHPIHIYQKALSKSGLFSYLAFFRGYYDASHILKLLCKITVHTHKIIYSTWEWAFWTLIYLLIINMFWTSALIFLIWLLFRG